MKRLPTGLRHIWMPLLAVLALLTAGCAHRAPPPPAATHLLNDSLFEAPAVAIDRSQVFALSPAMLRYAQTALRPGPANPDPRRTLIEALYSRNQLRLSYDAGAAAVVLRAENEPGKAVRITYAGLARHLGAPGPGATGLLRRGHVPPLRRDLDGPVPVRIIAFNDFHGALQPPQQAIRAAGPGVPGVQGGQAARPESRRRGPAEAGGRVAEG